MLQICVAATGLGMYLVLGLMGTYWGCEARQGRPLFARGRTVLVVVTVPTGGHDGQGGKGDVTAGRL